MPCVEVFSSDINTNPFSENPLRPSLWEGIAQSDRLKLEVVTID